MNDAASPSAIGVRPWRHYFGSFDLGARLGTYAGARVRGAGIDVARPAVPVVPGEFARLDASSRADSPAIEVFTTPALLRETFEALDPDRLPGPGSDSASGDWRAFAAEVSAFFAHVRAPLATPYRLMLDVRDPDVEVPLFAGGPSRALLGEALGGAQREPTARSIAAYVNLGSTVTAYAFASVAMPEMALRLAKCGAEPPPNLPALVLEFVRRFEDAPWLRLELAPGEGVFVPAAVVALDVDPRGAADLVVSLVALPGA